MHATSVLADLGDADQVGRVIAAINGEHEAVDILIADATTRPRAPFDEVTFEATFQLTRA